MNDHPDEKTYGPIVIFCIVLALFAWALALRRLGAK